MEQDQLSTRLKDVNQWTRILYIVLFAVAYYAANFLLGIVVLVQIGTSLVTGGPNLKLSQFAGGLTHYLFQLARFLTYNSEDKPFPVEDWPEGAWPLEPVAQVAASTATAGNPTSAQAPVNVAVPADTEDKPNSAADDSADQQAGNSTEDEKADGTAVKKPRRSATKKASSEAVKPADSGADEEASKGTDPGP